MNRDKNIINSYIQFAAAIVNSGIAAHDEVFLKSEWCQELIDAVVDFHNSDNTLSGSNTLLLTGTHTKEV